MIGGWGGSGDETRGIKCWAVGSGSGTGKRIYGDGPVFYLGTNHVPRVGGECKPAGILVVLAVVFLFYSGTARVNTPTLIRVAMYSTEYEPPTCTHILLLV